MASTPSSISVVTPSLNQGRFLADAIDSVTLQNRAGTEHIIVDACSTDQTLPLLRSLGNTAGLRWASEPDMGQSDAINKGFRLARGDVVAWLNADDYYQPNTFQRVLDAFAARPDLDVVYGEASFVDERGRLLRVKRDHAFDYRVLLYYGCYITSTTTFFRRRIIDDGHFLDVDFRAAMDYEYFVRLAKKGYRFGFIPESLAAFRWHDDNASTRLAMRRREERLVVQRQYGGLEWVQVPRLREQAFDLLARVYQGKRVARRALETLSGVRTRVVL